MSSTTKKSTRGYIILALDFLLFLTLIKTLPFTPMENRGLALLVFIGILWLTEAFNITVTSLMVPILAIGLNVLPTKAAFAPFSEPIIFMFFGGFVLAAVMNIQKLDLWIANHIIRLASGNLKLTVLYLFAATAGLSLFINNTAVAAMMLPLTLGILKKVDLKTNRDLYVFVLLGIAFSASIGGIGTLTGSAPNAILASQLKITFSEWLFYGMPVTILLMIGMVFSLLVILRPNFNVPFEISLEEIPMTGKRKITLAVFVIAAFFLVFGSWLEPMIRSALELSQPIKNFDAVVAMTAVIILCVTHTATWSEIQDRTEWGVLMLFGGGLVLGIVLKETGASKILADTIVSYIGAQHWLVMTLVLTAFIVFLTEFTSNTATAALMIPIFISVAEGVGLPSVSLAAIVACSASCAFMLPIATPPNAIVFSTGYIKQSEMVKVGFLLNIISTLVIGGLTYFFWINWGK
ncbi:SLC13 family permease [Haemophilus paraphrohaemolyticus]|uniref:Transporter, DASS family n=1 Tax=Haemophilus paraphrohaemolyticus HK411 TaxID=1095743 RepID=I2NH61_9PAST|nr:DASS family sodium-coupled anion symporter [Haemophilus paraphrohaemolyticus]EIG25172.1 transporter, DASS family [Haemophilus paraphrohaemolyticus HK411]OOR94174.1 transporter [Haemophilus paraphrohaemolyticus]STP00695.1 Na(+)/dicarboxylate symporter [Haemophilus paraphrohaemolyticus]